MVVILMVVYNRERHVVYTFIELKDGTLWDIGTS